MTPLELQAKSLQLRRLILDNVRDKPSHLGGTFSILDILIYMAYQLEIPVKSLLIGKGHACLSSWSIMVDRGELSKETWEGYGKDGAQLGGQFDTTNGAYNSGSIGHVLGIGAGVALADRNKPVYVIVGDAEMQEGACWEAIQFAGRQSLKNLTLIIDDNKYGVSGRTSEKSGLKSPFVAQFEAFGWAVTDINGHNFESIQKAFNRTYSQSHVIIADTIKGRGIKELELSGSHHGKLTSQQVDTYLQELV